MTDDQTTRLLIESINKLDRKTDRLFGKYDELRDDINRQHGETLALFATNRERCHEMHGVIDRNGFRMNARVEVLEEERAARRKSELWFKRMMVGTIAVMILEKIASYTIPYFGG